GRDIEVVVHAAHPDLNRQVARLLGSGTRIDVLSTHSKYAPSQARWLRPLDDVVPAELVRPLAPKALNLCRWQGALLCVPRNIDVRVLWVRSDRVDPVPGTWDDLLGSPASFGFPGRESGLFGTFFELVTSGGGSLFDDDLTPTMATPEAQSAIDTLVQLARRAPEGLPDWHYDEVDAALREGLVDMAAAWPGGYGPLRSAPFYDRLEPHPYLAGKGGWFSYAGCHAWAIPTTCRDVDGAVDLLGLLLSDEGHRREAAGGGVCSHVDVFASVQPIDEKDERRRQITQRTIAEAMITYPPLASFPAVEDAGWSAIREALCGRSTASQAAAAIQ